MTLPLGWEVHMRWRDNKLLSLMAVKWLLIIFNSLGEDDAPHIQPCWPWQMVDVGSVTTRLEIRQISECK